MKRWIITAALLAAGIVQAKQLNNPDANTLWIEDGKDIKLSKIPNFKSWCLYKNKELEIKSNDGGKVKFIAELAKEAEDVSITLTTAGKPRPVKVNGELKIQLKPADKTQKIWTAEIEVKSIGLKKAVKRHQLFMKTDVLGGDLDEPVWVGLPYVVKP